MKPIELQPHCEWTTRDVVDRQDWLQHLSEYERVELLHATGNARDEHLHDDRTAIVFEDFPLILLGRRLRTLRASLAGSPGFFVLRGISKHWNNDAATTAFWGISLHLGVPQPQDQRGTLLADVIDTGKRIDDPNTRIYQTNAALQCHTDGADFAGMLCLEPAALGGSTRLVSAVALHNRMIRNEPELAAELYSPVPHDFRDALPGQAQWYFKPVFSRTGDRLSVFLLREYALSSQRHADAPRLRPATVEALDWLQNLAETDYRHSLQLDLQRGDMLFLNNHHVLHGRSAYTDGPTSRRHLKRIWLKAK